MMSAEPISELHIPTPQLKCERSQVRSFGQFALAAAPIWAIMCHHGSPLIFSLAGE
jgi:hypothetical protein